MTSVMFQFYPIQQEVLSLLPDVQVISAKVFNVPLFDFKRYWKIIQSRVSIVANTCWGGLTYHSLYMEFLSPFINLTIAPDEYLKMLADFQYYMQQDLVMVKDRDCGGNPIGKLDDIHINFVHYRNFSEAQECWKRRMKRLNYDNLFVVMPIMDQRASDIFQKLEIERKVGFCGSEAYAAANIYYISDYESSTEAKSAFGVRGFGSYLNDQARRRLYDYDDELGNRGAKTRKVYDVFKLLSGEQDFMRQLV